MDSDLASFEFARAYVQARRHQAPGFTGAVYIPVVKDERGKLVAVGRPVEWGPGIAERVITKKYELINLETADCYKILSSTRLETVSQQESPQKMPPAMVGVPLVRQRSSTVLQRMRSGCYMDRGITCISLPLITLRGCLCSVSLCLMVSLCLCLCPVVVERLSICSSLPIWHHFL